MLGVEVSLTSARNPQRNRESERTNVTLQQYLRCSTCYHQDDWVEKLSLAEFAHNNAVHASAGVAPFVANCGVHPRAFLGREEVLSVPAAEESVE